MRFGAVPTREAAGLIAAHTVREHGVILRKGQPIPAEDAARLHAAGVREIVAVSLEPGDVGEDAAAERLALRLAGPGLRRDSPFTGRCNLFAGQAGLLLLDRAGIDAVNAVDEAITVATLPAFRPVAAGEMVATVKIIPYAVAGAALEHACRIAPDRAVQVAPYTRTRVGVVSTLLPGLKDATVDKTLATLARRLAPTGAGIVAESRVPHEAGAVGAAIRARVAEGADLVVVFGASAITDRRDVIPAGIESAGGRIDHLGMPVDPGNLLLVGALGAVPVIGAPGCARSPKENGFDWILHRLLAGLAVTRADIVGLGVGGLLMEIGSRPQPRSGGTPADDDDH
ncbi:molybdopterin-binding protein [Methylobacterium sp. Leaf100]|uniref:molybdopterin-binding protein n=1 Tax=Methylobacterium sp. Leaf100 TaxID=1736252 RepID=UPI0006FB3CBC|nr:molybdopterin-binding protein [Methylobacterium sp. Leaf100]KQP32302.1 molybdopterin-binding protein [Methylobacterium sp. Leaf100]